ncbi:hypothetical protein JG687_00003256 [Phytophthora cactorum]|uniref:Uncharacterized protein n=1 Tax=Phytophthora cactorum TaxID=29920 RepID=A0A329SWS8_9STRA|nr:hypothetical protein Pcac1_g3770 [Phytophthora cactorum]KAG2847707.1 hypothetical protein PC112_g960 [Phytophthora cactorum]KAG2848130.1 hypothetical protein PC111_g516 [Phytophthora cactorum]KAG2868430.1 hypothetical protein PC113_g1072 [Phytophthora cactorum]KAG2933631.1 hypothetical protein PC114_g1322 [Phytophthora cactorum]
MENATAPSCSVSGSQRNRQTDADADSANQQAPAQPEHDMFGDWNLNTFMMFMLLLHFMQYAMRQPCGC